MTTTPEASSGSSTEPPGSPPDAGSTDAGPVVAGGRRSALRGPLRSLRRFVAVAAAGVVGVGLGAAAMLAGQDRSVRCHRAVVDAIEGALRELIANGLDTLVEQDAFKGCWNPRYVRNGDDISRHAWGVAIDLNYDDNPTGLGSVQDPRLVAIFERWGFVSGDSWLKPGAGHFEYVGPTGTPAAT